MKRETSLVHVMLDVDCRRLFRVSVFLDEVMIAFL